MNCELCNKNPATVHFKQVADGVSKELFVCAECAAKNGFEIQSPTSLTDFLFGVGFETGEKKPPKETGKICPVCKMTRRDFDKTSRLGCPACYDTFETELAPMMADTHVGDRHQGKVPASARVSAEALALQDALSKAVARQDFEEAAVLRDKLKAIHPEP
jgi:protein arginine kinase activator